MSNRRTAEVHLDAAKAVPFTAFVQSLLAARSTSNISLREEIVCGSNRPLSVVGAHSPRF